MGKFQDARIQEEFMGISNWNKLDSWQKTNRIEEYLHRYMEENDIDIKLSDMKKKLLNISGKDSNLGSGNNSRNFKPFTIICNR